MFCHHRYLLPKILELRCCRGREGRGGDGGWRGDGDKEKSGIEVVEMGYCRERWGGGRGVVDGEERGIEGFEEGEVD